jgi:Cdc6-like AAA superfamily ATPase
VTTGMLFSRRDLSSGFRGSFGPGSRQTRGSLRFALHAHYYRVMVQDRFGLQRERRIQASGVREIFTPHRPIMNVDLLFGREDEVRSLIEHMDTPGQHALLYGERGVGKSSLAHVTADVFLSTIVRGQVHKKRCDSEDTFISIVRDPLSAVGVDVELHEHSAGTSRKRTAGVGWRGLGVGRDKEATDTATYHRSAPSPSVVANYLAKLRGILLIDEAEAIKSAADKRRLAELIKHLSDQGSPFKVLVVGIAETGGELTGAHPSVGRCLKETKLGRMKSAELREIVESGAARLHLRFEPPVVASIVGCSAGYPHFTHLLALTCAEEAIAERRREVEPEHLKQAMKLAVTDAEGSLKRVYDRAVRSASTRMYGWILLAAASLQEMEFNATDLRKAIATVTGEEISQASLNNYFGRLVSADESTILMRVATGVYRFTDPRMPSFVKIANQHL